MRLSIDEYEKFSLLIKKCAMSQSLYDSRVSVLLNALRHDLFKERERERESEREREREREKRDKMDIKGLGNKLIV
jgi:hypothetical protein